MLYITEGNLFAEIRNFEGCIKAVVAANHEEAVKKLGAQVARLIQMREKPWN